MHKNREMKIEKSGAFRAISTLLFGTLLPVILEGHAWHLLKLCKTGEIMKRI